jgi:S-DNA-T family DNA segregation ATPase FtsK/SpoIIIE
MGKVKANRRLPEKERARRGERDRDPARRGKAPPTGMARDVGAVVLFALASALGLSLGTFSSLDGALLARDLPPSNLVGRVGHVTASGVYTVLGFSALVLPVGIGVAAWRLFRGATTRVSVVGALAYAVLTLSLATLAHLALGASALASFPAGGAVGAALARISVGALSVFGSVIAVAAMATVALIVATDLKVRDVAGAFRDLAAGLAGFVRSRMSDALEEHRAAVAVMRAEEAARRAEAEALADTAEVEAASDDARAEGRQAAAELALEHLRRQATFDDPAWVDGLEPAAADGGQAAPEIVRAGEDAAAEAAGEAPPRRRRREKAAEADARKVEAPEGAAAAKAGPPEPQPVLPLPLPQVRPEIVVSQAMLDRARRKDREVKKKDGPSFAFEKAGDVFRLPPTDLLDAHEEKAKDLDTGGLTRTAEVIVATLKQHGVEGVIRHIRPGPVVTLYEFIPVAGVKLSRIENLDKELTMALSATRIRIIAPIPGKGVVGIEVPNKDRATVWLRDILESEGFANAGGLMPLGLGKNIEGLPYCVDLQRMPHLLIAGTTGSGKSVGLNTMILSMLYRHTPAEIRMIMVDPKMTELSAYEDIPHLLLPVVTDSQKAARALQWAVDEMERRTQILADTGSKDLRSYNGKVEKLRAAGKTFEDEREDAPPPKRLVVVDVAAGETEEAAAGALADTATGAEPAPVPGFTDLAAAPSPEFEDPTAPPAPHRAQAQPDEAAPERAGGSGGNHPPDRRLPQKLPYIVVVIDELADLMMTAGREVEISLARLAQKARATGIHLMVATQRPSTDVITGMIKNNFPARISFRLASRHDSTTILNGPGAESLLGDGDMLVMTATQPITRVQGAFVSEGELERVVDFLKEQGKPVYDESILRAPDEGGPRAAAEEEDDAVYDEAIALVARMEEVSVSKLQREMRLGYNKAAKIIERMEREGIVGPPNGVKPRRVLIRPVGEATPLPNV